MTDLPAVCDLLRRVLASACGLRGRRLCCIVALSGFCFGCATSLEQNVCEPAATKSEPHAYLQQCRISDDQLQMLLSPPAQAPYVLPIPREQR